MKIVVRCYRTKTPKFYGVKDQLSQIFNRTTRQIRGSPWFEGLSLKSGVKIFLKWGVVSFEMNLRHKNHKIAFSGLRFIMTLIRIKKRKIIKNIILLLIYTCCTSKCLLLLILENSMCIKPLKVSLWGGDNNICTFMHKKCI